MMTGATWKKLMITLMVSMLCPASHLTSSGRSTQAQAPVRQPANNDCAKVKFANLSSYKGERWWRVFSDSEIGPALRNLLKREFGKLKESLKEVSYPEDSLSYLDKNGVLTFEGGVPGLYTIMEAKLVIEPCGNIYAAILDGGKEFLYFSNDQKYLDKLSPAIEQWRSKIESMRSQPSEVPKLPVVFKSSSK